MARVVRAQPTPNPNAMRLSLGEDALGERSRSYASPQAAQGVPWAESLLAIPGVRTLFGMRDFVTLTKSPEASWDAIVPAAVRLLEAARF